MTTPILDVTTSANGGVLAPTNTRVLLAEFDYVRPASLDEALTALAEHGRGARLLAGGTDLLVALKMERTTVDRLIGLSGLAELRGIEAGETLAIGATTSIRAAAGSAAVREGHTALADACESFSTVPIMLMGTIGGNLCNASPASDTAPALLALGADVELVSRTDARTLPLTQLFTGPGATAVRPDELLRRVRLPRAGADTGSAFVKVARVGADIAKVAAAAWVVRDGDTIVDARVALGSVAPTPLLAIEAAVSLRGRGVDAGLLAQAGRIAASESAPITDVRSTEAYRRDVVAVIVRDALTKAWSRSGGKEIS